MQLKFVFYKYSSYHKNILILFNSIKWEVDYNV